MQKPYSRFHNILKVCPKVWQFISAALATPYKNKAKNKTDNNGDFVSILTTKIIENN